MRALALDICRDATAGAHAHTLTLVCRTSLIDVPFSLWCACFSSFLLVSLVPVEEPRFVRDLLHKAESNDIEWVRHFLISPEFHLKYDWPQTAGEALVVAAANNHAELVTLLLDGGASANLYQGKPLQRAAFRGALEAAEALVRGGADVNSRSIFAEYVPLHYAAQVGAGPLVRFLLSRGANVDATCHPEQCVTFNGWCALHFAADAGHLEVVQLLLEHGAQSDNINSNGDTALAIAAERGQWEVARWLVAAGANINATRVSRSTQD
jgi:hypothetical protein